MDEFYEGLEHNKVMNDNLIYDGYNWITPKESGLPEHLTPIAIYENENDIILEKGDWLWNRPYHGGGGYWEQIEEKRILNGKYWSKATYARNN